jgi:hemophore-related protein
MTTVRIDYGSGRCANMQSTTKLIVGVGGLLASLTVGAGIATAQPGLDAIINTTCSYPQVMAALNANSPDAAGELSSSPLATIWLQQLLAAPPDQRRQMINDVQGMPAVQQYGSVAGQAANTCNKF